MKNPYEVIRSLIHTEKETNILSPSGKYLFWVGKSSTKVEIKEAVEKTYKVDVESVNTLISPGKLKRVRHQPGYTSDWKRAVVTLKKGQKIEVT